jgi:hypothetical protein
MLYLAMLYPRRGEAGISCCILPCCIRGGVKQAFMLYLAMLHPRRGEAGISGLR